MKCMFVLMYVMPNKYNSKVLNIIKRGYLLQKIKIYTKHEHPGLLDIGCIGVLCLPIISGPSSYWASLPMRINHSLNLYIIFRHRVQPSNLKPLGELKIYYHLHKYTFTFHLSRESHMPFLATVSYSYCSMYFHPCLIGLRSILKARTHTCLPRKEGVQ